MDKNKTYTCWFPYDLKHFNYKIVFARKSLDGKGIFCYWQDKDNRWYHSAHYYECDGFASAYDAMKDADKMLTDICGFTLLEDNEQSQKYLILMD